MLKRIIYFINPLVKDIENSSINTFLTFLFRHAHAHAINIRKWCESEKSNKVWSYFNAYAINRVSRV